MAVSYAQVLSTDMIMSEVDALIDWHSAVLRQCFFPGVEGKPVDYQAPSALLMWCKRGAEQGTVDRAVAERLARMHDEVCKAAKEALDHCAKDILTTELYDALERQVEAFIIHIRRLQQDLSGEAAAVDIVTGLRTASGMRNDVRREQDRYDRKGTPFCITGIEIDKMTELQSTLDRGQEDALYAHVAQIIARTVRSFDDAYFLGRGEFMLMLKHIDFLDACVVVDRLRKEISDTPVSLTGMADKLRITASFGIAEAAQREPFAELLDHAREALQDAKAAGGDKVIEHHQTSGLAQYSRIKKDQGQG